MRNAGLALFLFSCSVRACAATEGPLFQERDASQGAPASSAGRDAQGEAGNRGAAQGESIRPGMRFQYQLVGTLDPNADAELFVLDLFETKRAEIERLHALGRVVIAFVAAGSYEPWRPDVDALPDAVIGKPLVGYPDEYPDGRRVHAVRRFGGL